MDEFIYINSAVYQSYGGLVMYSYTPIDVKTEVSCTLFHYLYPLTNRRLFNLSKLRH